MSFEQDWAQARSYAAARQEGRTRLDSAGDTGGSADLKTSSSGKAAAIKSLNETIRPGTVKAGTRSDEASDAAVREFNGWATGAGLKDAHDEWGLQVKNLNARLEADENALRDTNRDFTQLNTGIKSEFAQLGRHGGAGAQ